MYHPKQLFILLSYGLDCVVNWIVQTVFAANQAYNLGIEFTEQFRPEIKRRLHKIALLLIGYDW